MAQAMSLEYLKKLAVMLEQKDIYSFFSHALKYNLLRKDCD